MSKIQKLTNNYDFTSKAYNSKSVDFKEIGSRIKTTRCHLELTQESLAEAAGLSPSYLGRVERGGNPSLRSLMKIATALNVTVDYLLTSYQPADESAYFPELQDLLQDCTPWERTAICKAATAMKESLRRSLAAAG